MSSSPGNLIPAGDRARLEAFRRAAAQIRESSVIAEGRSVVMTVRPRASGQGEIAWTLLDREAFRSLVLSLRLVYMVGEPAHFDSVCNILWRHVPEVLREWLAEIRGFYREILIMEIASFQLMNDDGTERKVRPGEVLETWMYADTFHLDPARQELFDSLNENPDAFRFSIQSTAMMLCGRVMDLDDMIADLLGQTRIPRIEPNESLASMPRREST